ncbi:MAG TPA: hypothetical protein VNP98_09285 [Chthoniobacterales bacterium]|nr:hypothetical protein [Chthoniobacterales bacterium]
MSRSRPIHFGRILSIFGALAFSGVLIQPGFAGESAPALDEENAAKNLARMNCGAKIDCITPDGRLVAVPTASERNASATALIMDDDTLSCPLQEGETTFIISFPKTSLLDRFTFVNENAAVQGEMRIAVSNYRLPADSPKWTDVSGKTAFTSKRLFNLSMVGVEARYVKLSFNVAKGGRIASLGLFGGVSLEKYANRQDGLARVANPLPTHRIEDMLNFNFANLYAKGRIVFVSSGASATAPSMIDDDTMTAFRFASSDPQPTVIVELATQERLHRVSALYKMQAGQLDVYLLNDLGTNPADLTGAKSIASVVDRDAEGKAAVNFDPQGARYVALRWTPANPDRRQGFEVAEINAFGNMPLAMLNISGVPDVYASNLTRMSGDGGLDFSNNLGTLAAPPVLPIVSP